MSQNKGDSVVTFNNRRAAQDLWEFGEDQYIEKAWALSDEQLEKIGRKTYDNFSPDTYRKIGKKMPVSGYDIGFITALTLIEYFEGKIRPLARSRRRDGNTLPKDFDFSLNKESATLVNRIARNGNSPAHRLRKRRERILIGAVIVLFTIAMFLLYILTIGPRVSESKIQLMAKEAVDKYCLDKNYGKNWCDNVHLVSKEGPLDYGPTDGSDEYVGNWFFYYSTSDTSEKQIYIALDLQGKVLYINKTGEREYPYCTHGYTSDGVKCYGQDM